MLILSIDTSGKIASCALMENGVLLREKRQDSLLDHSRLLLPLCQELLREAGKQPGDVDLFSAVIGPGSFTGIRIGTAAAKGLAWALEKPCKGVSSLLSMAWNWDGEGPVCCAIHARPGEHYYALFSKQGDALLRLTEDIVGPDGDMEAAMASHGCTARLEDCPSASGAARDAWQAYLRGVTETCHEMNPAYLRITQAERMRKERQV